MPRLALSLIALVLVATFATGLALDRLFEVLGGEASEPLDAWRTLGRQLADRVLDGDGALSGDVPGSTLLRRSDLASDAGEGGTATRVALDAALESPLGLALESTEGIRVFYAVAGRPTVLALEHSIDAGRHDALRLALTLAFYLALLTLILVWLLPLLRRLARLGDASRAFGRGDLGVRVATRPASELHVLESAFNRMAARIQRLIEDNRLLGSGVAHDLRTPLARLRFGIDTLEERLECTPSGVGPLEHVHRLQDDIATMERLLDALLSYARFDGRRPDPPHAPLDLAALVRRHVEGQAWPASVRVEVHGEHAPIEGDVDTLGMLIDNLLQNASRHAAHAVHVGVARDGAAVELRVDDDGPGVPPALRERVLEPFVRHVDEGAGDRAGDGQGAGFRHGLGLALIARIAERHGASVTIGDAPVLGGARCAVRFVRSDA